MALQVREAGPTLEGGGKLVPSLIVALKGSLGVGDSCGDGLRDGCGVGLGAG